MRNCEFEVAFIARALRTTIGRELRSKIGHHDWGSYGLVGLATTIGAPTNPGFQGVSAYPERRQEGFNTVRLATQSGASAALDEKRPVLRWGPVLNRR